MSTVVAPASPLGEGIVPDSVAALAPFAAAGVLGPAEVQLAATVARLATDVPDDVLLAVALALRAPALGHTCVRLAEAPLLAGDSGGVADTGGAATEADGGPGAELWWPDPDAWRDALLACDEVVATPEAAGDRPLRPLVLDGDRLYLHRYWAHECSVAAQLVARAEPTGLDAAVVDAALEEVFGPSPGDAGGAAAADLQREAVATALRWRLSIIAGGPGTGKTTTVARLLLAVRHLTGGPAAASHGPGAAPDGAGTPLRVALAAPTGKAAARMTEAVARALGGEDAAARAGIGPATTVHRLLGWAPGPGFRHHARNPLEADLVVVDETSMVDLSLMAHLLDAVRPDARVVLVGDPHQLASVQAGTVLGDIVAAARKSRSPLHRSLTELTRVHRFEEGSAIAELAAAVRTGDAAAVLGHLAGSPAGATAFGVGMPAEPQGGPAAEPQEGTAAEPEWVRWIEDQDLPAIDALAGEVAVVGTAQVRAAREGRSEVALARAAHVKVLAATRRGPLGLHAWTDRVEGAVAGLLGASDPDGTATLRRGERWYVGKPVLVTANDPVLRVANGDVGVVVARPPDGATEEASPAPSAAAAVRAVAARLEGGLRHLAAARLDHVEPWWAMTIHKSQGSEFPHVVVSLPPATSRILTRELLYTAVTRAKRSVTVIGSEAAIRAAVERPVARASGLRERLVGPSR